MKDPKIEELVTQLQSSVDNVNVIMQLLQELNVEVRIAYVEKNTSKDISQGISLWKVEERNGYL
jgi:hypothetical protein